MKPMVYDEIRTEPEILLDGECMGYRFLIVSYGTHPCAYVEIKEGHPLYGVGYEKASECVSVHGGFTYARSLAHVIGPNDGYFLGWDYSHCGDCIPPYHMDGHKYTTEEILSDVIDAIEELMNVQC